MIIHIYAKVSNINSFYIFNNKSHADPANYLKNLAYVKVLLYNTKKNLKLRVKPR
ncbi:hypothetical protein [uncultured Gammaproteobacteria bacterium]|jgi:hypothetical protein|nr:hypothetical protein [uncultured Gammaproteobacteria bacterium]CAC9967153.1 hypothetical protein [uncultured Gammaproteobacteria bacterium]